MKNALDVDWSTIPAPCNDGAADHLENIAVPSLALVGTHGGMVDVSALEGIVVVYAYPMTGCPGVPLPEGWEIIPGARGCTPQACAFKDHFAELRLLGVKHLFGLSTQDTAYQREAVERLHLPFPLLSDERLEFAKVLQLPTFRAAEHTLLKRLTLIMSNGCIRRVFYPVFPPDRNAEEVVNWLKTNRQAC